MTDLTANRNYPNRTRRNPPAGKLKLFYRDGKPFIGRSRQSAGVPASPFELEMWERIAELEAEVRELRKAVQDG